MTRDIKEIIEHFKETGTHVREMQTIEIDGLHIIGMKFEHDKAPLVQNKLGEKIVNLFPDEDVLILLLEDDDNFIDFCDEHKEYLQKMIEAQTN